MEKTRCKTHPSELISNFCANQSCMVELCATCIGQHTEYHHQHLNTVPRYENIKNTLALTNQKLVKQKQRITQSKNRIKSLMDQVSRKKKDIQRILKSAKEDITQMIDKIFNEMEKELFIQLQKQKQKTGLHSEQHLEQIYLEVNKKSLEIYQKAQELNSFKYPEMIRQIYTDTLEKNTAFLEIVDREITQNQLFKMDISYQPSALKQICSGIKKIVSTSFTYPSRKNRDSSPKQTCPFAQSNRTVSPFKNLSGLESSRSPFRQTVNSNMQRPVMRKVSSIPINNQRSPSHRFQQSIYSTRNSQNWPNNQQYVTPKFSHTYGF